MSQFEKERDLDHERRDALRARVVAYDPSWDWMTPAEREEWRRGNGVADSWLAQTSGAPAGSIVLDRLGPCEENDLGHILSPFSDGSRQWCTACKNYVTRY
jgi:hypothetical protein